MSEVATLRFEGLLRMGDNPDTPWVGDAEPFWKNRDVLKELQNEAKYGHPQCAIQVTVSGETLTAEGRLDLDEGITAYSNLTPGEPSKFCIGPHDVLEFLSRYDGQNVIIDIAIPGAEG